MPNDWKPVDEARQRWEQGPLTSALEKSPERQARFETVSGREVERLYLPTPDSLSGYADALGFPGEYPFTRGVQPTMYRGRLWTMRQYAGFGTAEESNRRYKYLLGQGTTGLSVAFDLPTQIGYDSDDPMALGEVGKVGVAIDTLADMETLFDGIPLDRVSTSMTINATAAVLLAMYIVVAEKQGVAPDRIEGTVQNDILKEYIARGTYIFPPRPSLRLVSDIFAYCTTHVPRWNTISISGYHIREAGATAGQEIGFTLADAICYVQAAIDAGLEVDQFAPRLAFFFAAHTDLFEEVAKFRAARRLYARIMRERFGAADPKSWMLRFHTQTGGVTLTAQQPDNNIVRVTMQALAAVLGGTQSLHTNSRDEALALPTEESVTIALRTQQILAHEAGVASTVDPLGGSYLVEQLTDQLEEEAATWIRKIDELGGMVSAIEQGYVQDAIEASAYTLGQSIESGERVVVGVNRFTSDAEPALELLRIDEAVARRQTEELEAVRLARDSARVTQALAAVTRAAQASDNLMPVILEAVRCYASIGEICDALREVFGEHRDSYA
ncbi:MAG: methylmalonyl-CoA mutase family protein [Acidobacteria bacterium]|nr:methylmalonyl-CoA mutase family protein [Planctomycetota bacterium]MBE3132663.1 methylmalonyl-CoA mutase family protein [Acidobacteriota bacterium]